MYFQFIRKIKLLKNHQKYENYSDYCRKVNIICFTVLWKMLKADNPYGFLGNISGVLKFAYL